MNKKFETMDVIAIIVSILPIIYSYLTNTKNVNQQAFVVIGIVLILVILGLGYNRASAKYKELVATNDFCKKKIESIERDLNIKNQIHIMEVKLNVLDELVKQKKGEVDYVKLAILIAIILLVILFFKIVRGW